MGGFYLCRDDGRADGRLADARQQFDRHGFSQPTDLSIPGWRGFHVPYIHGGPDLFLERGDDFAAVAGTLAYDGRLGTPALHALLDDATIPRSDRSKTSGHFGLILRKFGRTLVCTDSFGAFQVFHDTDLSVITTSFLAAAASVERLHWNAQAVYEFAFNVFPTGDDSVFEEVRRLGPDEQLELGDTVIRHVVPRQPELSQAPVPIADLRDQIAVRLRDIVRPFADYFGDRVQCPLSGGLDSRLALALLRDAGVSPHVYVYGAPGDEDVEIARAIGSGEGFPVEVFQKAAWRPMPPEAFAAQVERNFHETDALVTDGGLFDNGGNAFARHKRAEGGQLAVSGGCGEVFRNFFYLPDQRLRARQVVEAFYARYSLMDTTDAFDPRSFIDAIEGKALASIGQPGEHGPLDRQLIEQLYPAHRCRSFFGREISLVARHGAYLMPFLEPSVVELALQLPIHDKNLGRFESALLSAIDPVLAHYPSAYGHRFTEPPTWQHRWSEWNTRARAPWLRRQSYALQRRIGRVMEDSHGGILTPLFLGRVIDLHFPHMARFFRMDRRHGTVQRDQGLYRRIATLEYLGDFVADRLA